MTDLFSILFKFKIPTYYRVTKKRVEPSFLQIWPIFDGFRQKWWKDAIYVRFRQFFCCSVHCSDMLGSGIILENIKILFFKIYTNWPNHKGTSSDLKTDTKITIFFISNLIYMGFRILTTCKKNFVALSQKLWIFL